MGWLAEKFIPNYGVSYREGKTRIAYCNHCQQITEQSNDVVLLQNSDDWVCFNCGTFSHVSPCTCGHCETHPYPKTKYTEKDIT